MLKVDGDAVQVDLQHQHPGVLPAEAVEATGTEAKAEAEAARAEA